MQIFFSLVCAYGVSGRMPMKQVLLVEWRRKGRGLRVARAGSRGGEGWEGHPISSLANKISNQLRIWYHFSIYPLNTHAGNIATAPITKFIELMMNEGL